MPIIRILMFPIFKAPKKNIRPSYHLVFLLANIESDCDPNFNLQ